MWTLPLFALSWTDLQVYLPVMVGGVVAVVVVTIAFIRWKNRPRYVPPTPLLVRPDADAWDHLEKSYADQRTSVRREGVAVPIVVTSVTFRSGVKSGCVLDRSTGGMRIALDTAVAPGSSLQVQAENAPRETAWVTLIVRSCKPSSQHYELGCEFETTPPWNVLLLFG